MASFNAIALALYLDATLPWISLPLSRHTKAAAATKTTRRPHSLAGACLPGLGGARGWTCIGHGVRADHLFGEPAILDQASICHRAGLRNGQRQREGCDYAALDELIADTLGRR